MSETLPSSQIRQAICFATPGMSSTQELLLSGAEVFRDVFVWARKIYVAGSNPVSFAAGSALAVNFGQDPTVQQIARFILGTLSIIRCSEDLNKLHSLKEKCSRIISGKEYIAVKGDRFNIAGSHASSSPEWMDQSRYEHRMRIERISALFHTVIDIFVTFGDLMLHMGDAYVAYNEECVSEVFIHGRDLWDELTSDQSYLVKQMKRSEQMNDWVLDKMNVGISTQVMMGVLSIPSMVISVLPDQADVTSAVSRVFDQAMLNAELNIQDMRASWQRFRGIDPEMQVESRYTFTVGAADDPEVTRLIVPPKRIPIPRRPNK